MSFHFPAGRGDMHFMSLGQGKTYIIVVDHVGRTVLYDAAANAIRTMPTMRAPKWLPTSFAATGSIYVIDTRIQPPGYNSFEVLNYGLAPKSSSHRRGWDWRSLPPPPYIHDEDKLLPPGFGSDDGDGDGDGEFPREITATAVVGDSRLWVSTAGDGSFSFDTVSGAWSKLHGGGGEWSLPFSGRAEYVADYNLWFGLSCQGDQLCASDLSTVTAWRAPPALLHARELDLGVARECIPGKSYMVYLGNGKFFVAKMFHVYDEDRIEIETFAVMMGVEVERSGGGGDGDGSNGGLRMIKLRSRRYDLNDRKTIDLVI